MAANLSFIVIAFLLCLAIHPSTVRSRNLKPIKKSLFSLEGSENGQTVEGLSMVKHFLEALGYWDPNVSVEDDRFDDSLEAALRAYQKFYRLKETGKLDADTVKEMSIPRCGVADHFHEPRGHGHGHGNSSSRFHTVAHYNFFQGNPRWSRTQLTYAFTADSVPVVPLQQLRPIIARAFQRWADVSQFQFQEVPVGQPSNIVIGFYRGDHGDGAPFDGPPKVGFNILAHAFRPEIGKFHYDADEPWSANPSPNQADLESVAVHEIGHLLGLRHSDDRTAIMYAEIGYGQIKRQLGQDDINGIRALYGN